MLEQLIVAVLDKPNKWHLNFHIWSLNLNLGFKPTSFKSLLAALAQLTLILPCHDHASYCALHWLCFFFVCRCSSPLSKTCTGDVIDDTDEELYYLRKCQASKTPLFIPIQSYSLAPALFYCIRTTTIHLLLVAVAEPFILCMTCHCHSK